MDNKKIEEQWRKLPHNIAGVVEKMISLTWDALPYREDINDSLDMLKLRDDIYAHFSKASDHLCEAFHLANDGCEFFGYDRDCLEDCNYKEKGGELSD